MDFSNSSTSPKSSDSFDGTSHFVQTPSNANNNMISPYELNVIFYNTMKKLKTENNSQPCAVKKDHKQNFYNASLHLSTSPEFSQSSTAAPFILKKPQNVPQAPKQNRPNLRDYPYNLENFAQNLTSMNGKRIHPEYAFRAPRVHPQQGTMKHISNYQRVFNKRDQINKNIYHNVPAQNALNGLQRPNLEYNEALFGQMNLPTNPVSQATFLYNLEQQLKSYNELAMHVQNAKNAQMMRSKLLGEMGKNNLASDFTQTSQVQPKTTQTVKRCFIEEVTASEKNFKQTVEHLEKRHQANFVTKLQPGAPGKENKVFEFSSTKFNLIITNKKNDKTPQQSFRKSSGQSEDDNRIKTNEGSRRLNPLLIPGTSLLQSHNNQFSLRNSMIAQNMLNCNTN